MYHKYSFSAIWGWLYYGWVQRILHVTPLIKPEKVEGIPVTWWWDYYSSWDWYSNLGADKVPSSLWIKLWQNGTYLLLRQWVGEVGDGASDNAVAFVRGFIGYVQGAYPTFSSWLGAVSGWVGPLGLWWANNLTAGLNLVRSFIPEPIRDAASSWDDLWEAIKASVRDWVIGAYYWVSRWAEDSWNWVADVGTYIRGWYDIAHDWLDDFRWNAQTRVTGWLGSAWTWLVGFWNDPRGAILGILGAVWESLSTFARDALPYYYNLWGSYAETLGAFLEDPLGWLYDRVEDELIKRW